MVGSERDDKAERAVRAQAEAAASNVLRFLGKQHLPATPVNYELGYLHHTDRESLAGRAVDAILITGDRVTQEQADYIVSAYRAVCSEPSEVEREAEASNGERLRHQTLHLADITADAATATGQFGRDLSAELGQMDRDRMPIAKTISTMIARSTETERHLVSALQKIDALHAEVAAAQNDALRDALTGLANRRGLQAELDKLDKAGSTALAICDIDRFKAINDRHGHPVGDRVIKAVADSIAGSCAPHVVARWGGEEFVVLMHGVSLPDAHAIVQSANDALQRRAFRIRESGESLDPITFSAGIVMMDCDALDAIAAADMLLYRAKQEGRNKVVVQGPASLAA